METCIYKVDYCYRSSVFMSFDNDHAVAYVETTPEIARDKSKLDLLMSKSGIEGICGINSVKEISVKKLLES